MEGVPAIKGAGYWNLTLGVGTVVLSLELTVGLTVDAVWCWKGSGEPTNVEALLDWSSATSSTMGEGRAEL